MSDLTETICRLLREVVNGHAGPGSHDYNECDEERCQWCADALEVIDQLEQ